VPALRPRAANDASLSRLTWNARSSWRPSGAHALLHLNLRLHNRKLLLHKNLHLLLHHFQLGLDHRLYLLLARRFGLGLELLAPATQLEESHFQILDIHLERLELLYHGQRAPAVSACWAWRSVTSGQAR